MLTPLYKGINELFIKGVHTETCYSSSYGVLLLDTDYIYIPYRVYPIYRMFQ